MRPRWSANWGRWRNCRAARRRAPARPSQLCASDALRWSRWRARRPSLLIDVIGRMGERMRKFNGAISLYTEALGALEHHELDPALLEELRNPIPDLADFGQTFGRMAEQTHSAPSARRRNGERSGHSARASAQSSGFRRRIPPRRLGVDDAGARRRRRFLRSRAARRRARRTRRRRRLRQGRARRFVHGHHQDSHPHQPARESRPARRDRQGERLSRRQQRRPAVRDGLIRRLRSALGRARILQLRPPSRAHPPPRRRGRDACLSAACRSACSSP